MIPYNLGYFDAFSIVTDELMNSVGQFVKYLKLCKLGSKQADDIHFSQVSYFNTKGLEFSVDMKCANFGIG